MRFEDLHEDADHAGGGVELAAALALGLGELLQEVLVDLAEQVAGLAGALAGEAGGVEQVQQFAEAALVHVVPVVDAGERGGEGLVVGHDELHGFIDELADRLGLGAVHRGQALGVLGQVGPAGPFGDPEHAAAGVLVDVVDQLGDLLLVEPVRLQLGLDLPAALLEGVRDVLQEHQAQDHVLVLGGIHGAAQLVRGLPEGVLEFLHGGRGEVHLQFRGHYWVPSVCGSASLVLGSVRVRLPPATPSVIRVASSSSRPRRSRACCCSCCSRASDSASFLRWASGDAAQAPLAPGLVRCAGGC